MADMFGYLKRRFSSGDLQGEQADKQQQEGLPSFLSNLTNPQPQQHHPQHLQQHMAAHRDPPSQPPKRGPFPSAPTSPSKSINPASMFSQNPSVSGITGQISNTITRGIFSGRNYNKDHCKILLVIDEPHTDWSKYFRGRKIMTDWDVRVEQAVFSELSLASHAGQGLLVEISGDRSGTRMVRTFRPDFVLVRQHVRDAGVDWRPIIVGLVYGGIPSINQGVALFNLAERAWVFAHLGQIQCKLGPENFPLIEQVFYPRYQDMMNAQENFPMVMKVGHAHNGVGKIRVGSQQDYHDVASIVGVSDRYATTEPLIDAKFDIHIQKIGSNYKAFLRRSISGTWKANVSSALLEQLPMTDKFRQWIDEVAQIFGGLDICSLECVQSKDGKITIIEMNGSDMPLLGDTQEEDRRIISELVLSRMHHACSAASARMPKTSSIGQNISRYTNGPAVPPQAPAAPVQAPLQVEA